MLEENKLLKEKLTQLEKYAPKKLFKNIETPSKEGLQSVLTSQSEAGYGSTTQRDYGSIAGKSEMSKINNKPIRSRRS